MQELLLNEDTITLHQSEANFHFRPGNTSFLAVLAAA